MQLEADHALYFRNKAAAGYPHMKIIEEVTKLGWQIAAN
jgi:hypothetical protein